VTDSDCKSCKSQIFAYVREIKDDLKEIVKEKGEAVIDHLTDLVFQINNSLNEGSARMTRIESKTTMNAERIDRVRDDLQKEIGAVRDSVKTDDQKRREIAIQVIVSVCIAFFAQAIIIATIISGSHQKIRDTDKMIENKCNDIKIEHQKLLGEVDRLKYRMSLLEK